MLAIRTVTFCTEIKRTPDHTLAVALLVVVLALVGASPLVSIV